MTAVLENPFLFLYEAAGSKPELLAAYDSFLRSLLSFGTWESGAVIGRRVLWNSGELARKEAPGEFASRGLYLWGAERRPLYIGITLRSFGKRFSRYIWSSRSQCKLSQDYEVALRERGLEGFPESVRSWYERRHKHSTVRLRGAVRFAEEGIGRVWFTLLPHDVPSEITELERSVVPVAEAWNFEAGFRPLLNVELKIRRPSRHECET